MLKIENLNKSYGKQIIFDNVTLNFKPACIAVLGRNGAGKSTFLNIISSLCSKDSGEINFNDLSIYKDITKWKLNIGIIPEDPNLFENLTILEHIQLSIKLYKLDLTNQEIDDSLEYFDLKKFKDYFVEECSQGMKKKLSIILGLIHNPSIIILDEPFNGLDIDSTYKLKQKILELKRDNNRLIFITSHMLDSLEKLIDEVVLINNCSVEHKTLAKIMSENQDLESYYLNSIGSVVV